MADRGGRLRTHGGLPFLRRPLDNEEDGPEGLINAWPMAEAYIDYVEGDPEAGIINNPDEFPQITAELIESLN